MSGCKTVNRIPSNHLAAYVKWPPGNIYSHAHMVEVHMLPLPTTLIDYRVLRKFEDIIQKGTKC